jgi:hypothetical protein
VFSSSTSSSEWDVVTALDNCGSDCDVSVLGHCAVHDGAIAARFARRIDGERAARDYSRRRAFWSLSFLPFHSCGDRFIVVAVLSQVERDLKTLPGILEVHDLHIWALTIGKTALSVHVKSNEDPALYGACDTARVALRVLSSLCLFVFSYADRMCALANGCSILRRANKMLRKKHGIKHTTIQVQRDECANCTDCNL